MNFTIFLYFYESNIKIFFKYSISKYLKSTYLKFTCIYIETRWREKIGVCIDAPWIFFFFFTQNLVITYFPLRSGTLNVHNIEGERKKEILLSVLTIEILWNWKFPSFLVVKEPLMEAWTIDLPDGRMVIVMT